MRQAVAVEIRVLPAGALFAQTLAGLEPAEDQLLLRLPRRVGYRGRQVLPATSADCRELSEVDPDDVVEAPRGLAGAVTIFAGRGSKRWRCSMARKGVSVVTVLTLATAIAVAVPASFGKPVSAADLPPVAARSPLEGYFLAMSPLKDPQAFGGFGLQGNLPRKLDRPLPKNAITLLALPGERVPFGESNRGFRVLLANTTAATAHFAAADSRLSILREAMDDSGTWRIIEYLPAIWCGNSYHQLLLPSGQYWSFSAPEYAGPLKAKMRFRLFADREGKPVYSNEFEGSIHPDQFKPFWRCLARKTH
jgi:hypothetical protein